MLFRSKLHDANARIARDAGDYETMRKEQVLRAQATARANRMSAVLKEIERTEKEKINKVRALIKKRVPNAEFAPMPTPSAPED